jgi:hypothetical protein
MSEPTNHSALKRDVMMGRSFGYASSPIREEPAIIQKGMPNPSMKRAPTYMPAVVCYYKLHVKSRYPVIPLIEKAWITDPMTMIQEPRKIAHRRPNLSFTYGTSGRAQIAPRLYAEDMMPRSAPCG